MLSPDDQNFFKNLADKCLDLCKNNPSLTSNYKDVSNAFSQSLDIFLNQYNSNCLESLTNFEKEKEKFTKLGREIEFQQYMTEMLVERSERFKIGSKTTQVKFDNYQHFVDSHSKTTQIQKHRYNLKINEVLSLSNSGELATKKLHMNQKALFMDITNLKEVPFESSKQFVMAASIQNKFYIAGSASSFWACINPTMGDIKIDYSSPDCNLDFTKNNEFLTNSETMKKFYEKSIYNQDVINDIVTRSQQVEAISQKKTSKRPESIVFNASNLPNTTSSVDTMPKGSDGKSNHSITINSSVEEVIADDIAPPPDSEDEQPPPYLYKVNALFAYSAQSTAELGFQKDQIIDIIEEHDNGWFVGTIDGVQGYVPQNYVKKI